MKVEEQVTSLELSKKLKELGFKQESLFTWSDDTCSAWGAYISFKQYKNYSYHYSAYTIAELGEMLPPNTPSMKDGQGYECYTLMSEDGGQTHWDTLYEEDENFVPQRIWSSNEADARAKMLIWLKENGKI